MDMLTVSLVIIIALLIVASAFFSMSETAFTSASMPRLKTMAKDGDVRAEKAVQVLENYDKFLTTILIGNNLVNIAGTSIATVVCATLLGEATGSVVSTVLMTLLVLTFAEITPKTIAKRYPEKFVLKIVTVVRGIEAVFSPLSWAFGKLTRFVVKKMGVEEQMTVTEEVLETIIDEMDQEGVIEKVEGDLIKSAMHFDDTPVSDVYIPRVDVVAIDSKAYVDDIGKLIGESGFSRIPVYSGSIDNIIGVINAKEYYARRFSGEPFALMDLVRPMKYVPETMSIAAIFNDFQKTKVHMAVVLDSYGGTLGIVTLEDILEELVGDIWDESDNIEHDVVRQANGTWIVKGMANIYDVMEVIGVEFDTGEYDDKSVTGYITYRLNRVPIRGDKVSCGRVDIEIKSVKRRRIMECIFTVKEEEPQEEPAE